MKTFGSLRVPGDKSVSHRALILGALGAGVSRVTGILESADVQSTAGVLRSLGVEIPDLSSDFLIKGVGRRGFAQPAGDLDCGNSGTTTRLMAGVIAGYPAPMRATFVGDASLSRRPMKRIARPLEAMGATVELPPHNGLPMVVHGAALQPIEWTSEVASAQVKSAILLAALMSGVRVSVTEPARSRDHTERMLMARGAAVDIQENTVTLDGLSPLLAMDTVVPGDPSSAAFFLALGTLADSGDIRVNCVCMNETRSGFINALREMGAIMTIENRRLEGGDWIGDVIIESGRPMGATITEKEVPSMIDELPVLACMATRCLGETVITGANELRVKESDRIAAVVSNLKAIGADVEELPDGMVIRGNDKPLRGRVVTHGDHRLAMAFGVLGCARGNEIEIDDASCVAVSYPGFWDDLAKVHSR